MNGDEAVEINKGQMTGPHHPTKEDLTLSKDELWMESEQEDNCLDSGKSVHLSVLSS